MALYIFVPTQQPIEPQGKLLLSLERTDEVAFDPRPVGSRRLSSDVNSVFTFCLYATC